MSKSSSMTIRIDPQVKSDADTVLNYLGLTTSEAVTIFLRQVVISGGIPFPIKAPIYNSETLEAMREAQEIAKSNQRRFKDADEMFNDLGI